MQLIDTHVHINFDVFQGDLNSLERRWREAGVVHLVHSCVEPEEFQGIQSLADRFPELSFAVGLHPLDVQKWTDKTAQQIKTIASSDNRVVAIGETGLDLYKANNYQEQRLALESQLSIARELDKPVIIHCRDAAPQLKEIVSNFIKERGDVRGVMHCWGGTPQETAWFLDLGFYISFSGTVTFKKAEQIKESAKIVPQERILVETDCPFLAPVPKRGKTNEPSFVRYVARYVADLRGIPEEELARQTTVNACRLFKLDLNENN